MYCYSHDGAYTVATIDHATLVQVRPPYMVHITPLNYYYVSIFYGCWWVGRKPDYVGIFYLPVSDAVKLFKEGVVVSGNRTYTFTKQPVN